MSNAGKFTRLGSLIVPSPVSNLNSLPGLLAATDSQSNVDLFDPTDPANLHLVGSGKSPLCWWWPNLTDSDGNLTAGLWVPLGPYGVTHVPVQP